MIEIKNRYTGDVIFRSESAKTVLDALIEGMRRGCLFTRANLSGANLSGANLSGANLSGANLSGANLAGATLAHRHPDSAETEADYVIDHLNGDDDVRLLGDDIS